MKIDKPKEEVIWRNGHAFRNRPELAMRDWDVEQQMHTMVPYIDCRRCGARADSPMAHKLCLGTHVEFHGGSGRLAFPVEFTPKGRKPITETVEVDVDALIELVDILRQFPKDQWGRDDRGHGFWHWSNPERDFPCSTCPSPLGDEAKRLEKAQRDAIDVDVVPERLGMGT